MHRSAITLCSLILFLMLSTATIIYAHQLAVFAWLEGDTVMIQGKLSNGKRPKQGEVLVYNANDQLLLKLKLHPDGTASFPLENWDTGYRIVLDIGHGHQSYWILTPSDIQQQRTENK
jgi:nickel transport protein